ncbi:methionyl-tRNA formyltransferase [Aequorivita sp. SDUM287046]|uniref:Methionyl-tRNA formyltransferase n=1 Tax=Aequorivita aurantiaca TaxID=3053356 RepID=A0ABT8DIF9_9FLAO|nr:methionyl-tRNA formyltransferase [Aequorivita aurantiaca]MDN3723784.1 methionyl-tRNA formyltransferase [Aequorivita aurantiaca]
MQNDLRIVFMGTPDFAVGILKKMIEAGKNVVGVVTAPDKPAGRGRKLIGSAVKEYSLSQNLTILQPQNLKDENFLNELKSLDANLQVVVAFRMLPKVVWQMPQLGTFNLHASLLPQYRGAAPINWAIINNEETTGVTTFFIDEKIDTGTIIANEKIRIEKNETAGTLHDKLNTLGGELVIKTLQLIEEGKAEAKPQTENSRIKEAPKLTAENTRIDWTKSGAEIIALIRGLSPYPTAWTTLKNEGEALKIKIYSASFENKDHSLEPGTIETSKKSIKVACSDGYIIIDEIQFPGKRKMDSPSLLNGYSFDADSKLL